MEEKLIDILYEYANLKFANSIKKRDIVIKVNYKGYIFKEDNVLISVRNFTFVKNKYHEAWLSYFVIIKNNSLIIKPLSLFEGKKELFNNAIKNNFIALHLKNFFEHYDIYKINKKFVLGNMLVI